MSHVHPYHGDTFTTATKPPSAQPVSHWLSRTWLGRKTKLAPKNLDDGNHPLHSQVSTAVSGAPTSRWQKSMCNLEQFCTIARLSRNWIVHLKPPKVSSKISPACETIIPFEDINPTLNTSRFEFFQNRRQLWKLSMDESKLQQLSLIYPSTQLINRREGCREFNCFKTPSFGSRPFNNALIYLKEKREANWPPWLKCIIHEEREDFEVGVDLKGKGLFGHKLLTTTNKLQDHRPRSGILKISQESYF